MTKCVTADMQALYSRRRHALTLLVLLLTRRTTPLPASAIKIEPSASTVVAAGAFSDAKTCTATGSIPTLE